MNALLVTRMLIGGAGLSVVALLVWFLGPYLSIGGYQPLASPVTRLVVALVLVLIWAGWAQWRLFREAQRSRRIAEGLAEDDHDARARAAEEEAASLGAQFQDAVAALRKQGKGANLYTLPWYVIIGPPGSGKTTALAGSGLGFPLERQFGREAVRGVGGTRHCDFWFTDQAVFLDTAGRYTTQASDRDRDAAGWSRFLQLLKKYRRRQPLNGVLLTLSASDLMSMDEAALRAHVEALQARLGELERELKIALPAYLLITKCDLIAGFQEFFDDLDGDGRSQVWGTTFPVGHSRTGRAAESLFEELELLRRRIAAAVTGRLREERDARRRAAIFAFPVQLAILFQRLPELVTKVFPGAAPGPRVLLRGVYLCSATQEGAPVDRVLGALSRSFGLQAEAPAASFGRGQSYFLRRLLGQVVLGESGLAGRNLRAEVSSLLSRAGSYAVVAALTALGLAWLAVSFFGNRSYLERVELQLAALADTPAAAPAGAGADPASALPRLDALRAVWQAADEHEGSAPLRLRAGLYQGRSLGNAARAAYMRELNAHLVPRIAAGLEQRIGALPERPEQLYELLKAYLMLGQPERLEPAQLAYLADLDWRDRFAGQDELRRRLNAHLQALLAAPERLRPHPLNDTLVTQARGALRQAALSSLVFSRIQLEYGADPQAGLRLDLAAGIGAEDVLRRRGGAPLAEPVPALYTRDVFLELMSSGVDDLLARFPVEGWVVGEDLAAPARREELAAEVVARYERAYIEAWEARLSDLALVPIASVADSGRVLRILGSPASPLRGLVSTVAEQTDLSPPEADAGAGGAASSLGRVFGDSGQGVLRHPGQGVGEHFEPWSRLVAGEPGQAPVDRLLAVFADMAQRVESAGGTGAVRDGLGADLMRTLEGEVRQLPPALAALVNSVGAGAEQAVRGQAAGELAQLYLGDVLAECRAVIGQRYPFFVAAGEDVPLQDFARLFGPGGVYDAFFREQLAPLVDTTVTPWRWRGGAPAGMPADLPQRFEAAARIRQIYFGTGAALPALDLQVTPLALDAEVLGVVLSLDGSGIEYRHGPQQSHAVRWPGPNPGAARVSYTLADGASPSIGFDGPWAVWRLLDAGALQSESDVRFAWRIEMQGRSAQFRLDAASIRNPLGAPELARFRCES